MILYLTDNPHIKKEIPGAILLYQLFNWKVSIQDEEFKITNRFKIKDIKDQLKLNDELICIINPSNYKLQYEIQTLGKNVKFYSWESWKKRKEVSYKTKDEFLKYTQRSYLSYILYPQLVTLNLQRIEQYLVYLAINILEKKEIPYSRIQKIHDLINSVAIKRDSISYIVNKLIYHSRKLDISDPFSGSFKFLDKESSIFKLYKENEPDQFSTKKIAQICTLLNGIVPIVDILKTLSFMEESGFIIAENNHLSTNPPLKNVEIINSIDYLNLEKWKNLYKSKTYSFSMFPPLSFELLKFECPYCSSFLLKSSPHSFWCGNVECNFKFNRIIKPAGISKRIADWDFNKLLKYKSTIIKNSRGGYSRYILDDNYKAIPHMKSNDINPDKAITKELHKNVDSKTME